MYIEIKHRIIDTILKLSAYPLILSTFRPRLLMFPNPIMMSFVHLPIFHIFLVKKATSKT